MQSPNNPLAIKVKLSVSIVAIATLFGAVVLPALIRRIQKPTQPTQQIDIAPLNQVISELTREIQNTKQVIEKIKEAQEKQKEPEEKVPFRQKLVSSEYYKPTEVIQNIISIIGFGAVILGLFYTSQSVDSTNKQLQANAVSFNLTIDQNIMSHTLDVDKLFIDSPDLRPYFFGNYLGEKQYIFPSDKNYNKALAIADYQLDYFATFFDQSGDWQAFKNDPVAKNAWLQYFHDSFLRSPIMCERLKQVTNEYAPGFVDMFKGDCQNEFRSE